MDGNGRRPPLDDRPPPGDEDYRAAAVPTPNGASPVVAPRTWPTAADYLVQMGPVGRRWSTSFPALDALLRGGVPAGKRIVLVGAPGAAKTMLASLWAFLWEAAGALVVYLAADDSPEAVAMRLGQLAGYSRERLEADDDEARAAAAATLAGRQIVLLDGEDATLEDAITALHPGDGGRQGVLIVDSLQTVRCDQALGVDSIRERITTVMGVLRGPARAGAVVVAVSEMARSGYRGGGDRNLETSALSSAKESGAIEYAADLILGMRSVPGETGLIEIETAKNRLGRTPPNDERIRLRLDFHGASLSEVAAKDADVAARDAGAALLFKAKDRVRRAVMAQDLRTANGVHQVTKGTKAVMLAALKELEASGEITRVNGVYRLAPPEVSDAD